MEDRHQIQDQDLKDLLKGFQPSLSSNDKFISNLEKSLQAVDLVKEHTRSLRHKNYIALGMAFLVGMFVGVGLSILFPLFIGWALTFFVSAPTFEFSDFNIDWRILGWVLIGVTCVFTAKNAYDITLYKLSTSEEKSR